MQNDAVRRLVLESSSLLERMKEEMPPEYFTWIVEFETFEDAIKDVREEIKKGVI